METRIALLESQLASLGSRVNLNIAIGLIGILLAFLKLIFPIVP